MLKQLAIGTVPYAFLAVVRLYV